MRLDKYRTDRGERGRERERERGGGGRPFMTSDLYPGLLHVMALLAHTRHSVEGDI